jgi:hypothetical protein
MHGIDGHHSVAQCAIPKDLAALQYRNGPIISILAVTFLRREDLSRLCIGQHQVRNMGEWRINIAPSKSRNRRPTPMVFLIPGELTVFVDEYIARCRPALLAMRRRGISPCDAGNALWVGDDGGHCGTRRFTRSSPALPSRRLGARSIPICFVTAQRAPRRHVTLNTLASSHTFWGTNLLQLLSATTFTPEAMRPLGAGRPIGWRRQTSRQIKVADPLRDSQRQATVERRAEEAAARQQSAGTVGQ